MPPSPAQPLSRFLDESQALACVHCGLCLSACPTYLETGNENLSPRGRIYLMRALHAGRLPLDPHTVQPLDLCLGCRACEPACPSGVPYGALLEQTRDHIESHHRRSFLQSALRRLAIEQLFPYPDRLRLALAPALWLKQAGAGPSLPAFLRDTLELLPDSTQPGHLPEFSPASPDVPRRGRVGFLRGCVMNVLFGLTNENSIRLLNRAGFDVLTPPGQECCGALHAHGGRLDEARARARHNIATFEPLNLDALVVNAAGCGSTLKEYGHLLHHDPAWAARAQAFSARVRDLTEWLCSPGFLALLNPRPDGPRVTYHDACHLAHPQRITRQPRDLVRAIAGPRFVELPESDVCCGSAGSYNLTEPEMAARLQQRKTQRILSTGAGIVVTSNPGCILQIQAGLRQAGAPHIQVLHIADFLHHHLG